MYILCVIFSVSNWVSGKWLFSTHGYHCCQTLENLLHFQASFESNIRTCRSIEQSHLRIEQSSNQFFIFACRNPDSAKKRAITDCQLVTFVLLLFSLEIIVLLVYFGVEIAAPGYELERKLDQDQPRGLVGVCCAWMIPI